MASSVCLTKTFWGFRIRVRLLLDRRTRTRTRTRRTDGRTDGEIHTEQPALSPADESSTGSTTKKLPNFDATMPESWSHESAMSTLENASTDSSGSASPDTDFTGVSETIIGDSLSALGMAAGDPGKSRPPWKWIVPAALAVVVLIAFLVTRPDPAARPLESSPPNFSRRRATGRYSVR
jgi:hypothetical protein